MKLENMKRWLWENRVSIDCEDVKEFRYDQVITDYDNKEFPAYEVTAWYHDKDGEDDADEEDDEDGYIVGYLEAIEVISY